MTDRREEWRDGGSRRRAWSSPLSSCWAFNEVERLPGLFLPAVAPARPRYGLGPLSCPGHHTSKPTERTRKHKSAASAVSFSPTAWECKRPSIWLPPLFTYAGKTSKCHEDWNGRTQHIPLERYCLSPAHSIKQHSFFRINDKIYLIMKVNPCLYVLEKLTGDLEIDLASKTDSVITDFCQLKQSWAHLRSPIRVSRCTKWKHQRLNKNDGSPNTSSWRGTPPHWALDSYTSAATASWGAGSLLSACEVLISL